MTLSKLRVVLEASTGQFNRAMQSTARAFKRTDDSAKGLGTRMLSLKTAFTAMLGVLVLRKVFEVTKSIFDMGAAVEETESKFRTVFGSSSGGVQKFLDDFAVAAGLSNRVAQDLIATTAAMAQGMGFAQSASAELAQQVLRLSADLASFNNLPTAEVLNAVQSALVGEREQLKRMGIVLREVDVQQRAMTLSGKTTAKALTQQEKVLATVQLLYEKAGVAVGDLARTQDSAANTAKRLGARIENLKDQVASALLPAMAQLLGAVDDNSGAFDVLGRAIKTVSAFAAVTVASLQAIGPALAVAGAQIDVFAAKIRQSKVGAFFGLGGQKGITQTLTGLNPMVQLARFLAKDMPDSVAATETALLRMTTAMDIVNRETANNLINTLAQLAGTGGGGALPVATRSIDDFRAQLELTAENMPAVIQQIRLLEIATGKVPRVFEEAEKQISRLDDAVVGFALNFIDRIASATTQGAAAFDGFVRSVLAGLARIAAQMVIFDALKWMFPGSGLVSRIGAHLFPNSVASGDGHSPGVSFTGFSGKNLSAAKPVVFNQVVNFNIAALDGPSVARMIRSQKGTITAVIAEAAQESTAFKRTLR